jgi:hypothetical protein
MRFALVLGLTVLLGACGPTAAPEGNATNPGEPSGSVASGIRISPPPVTPPTPPGTNLPAFACLDWSGGTTGVANTVTARTAEQAGFDRFVLQLDSIVPTYTVKRQPTAVFQSGATGQTVTLLGNAGALVTVHSATGGTTFTGPTDFQHPEYQVLLEARQIQDFEGYVSWALGLSRASCLRAFTLQDPARLVVDFQTSSS